MATSVEIRDAAIALEAARAAYATAEAALLDANAVVAAAVATEQADLTAAQTAYNVALATAQDTPEWIDARATQQAAGQALGEALGSFAQLAAEYDGV